MLYKNFKDIKLSALGMGCMRLPVQEEDNARIDVEKARAIVDYAMNHGINYFDTAWVYHGGNSESVIGDILSKYPRDSYYIATKFPGFDHSTLNKVEEIFEAQLKKCKVEYFDFYLFHNVCEMNINEFLDPKYGIYDYLLRQKRLGRIKYLGFSTHGTLETMRRFLDAYGKEMDFCQIQLNWLDWKLQSAKEKVDLLREYGLPIWVMEPVRGGSLACLDPKYEARLKAIHPEHSAAKWCFRFLQSIPDVTVTLSGMSNLEQLKENIETYEEDIPLNEDEAGILFDVAKKMTEKTSLPCTACQYCTSHCPLEINIPFIIKLYNEFNYTQRSFHIKRAINGLPEGKKPSDCLGCGGCETVCPQNIKISEMMKDFSERLNG